jgi:hypothetical protein
MKSKNRGLVEKHINRALEMFDQLVAAESIECRLLIVENSDSDHRGYNQAVDEVVEFILSHELPGKRI